MLALFSSAMPMALASPPSSFVTLDGSAINQANAPAPPYDWANGGALTTSTSVGGTWSRGGTGGLFNGGKFQGINTPPTPPTLTPAAAADATITSARFIVDPLGTDVTPCGSGDPTTFNNGADKNNNDINGFTWALGSTPKKDDLSNVYAIAHLSGSTNEIYFGAERVVNNGASHVDFEFLQSSISTNATAGGCAPAGGGAFSGHRTQGDLLLSVDFTDGGTLGGFNVERWQCDATFSPAHNGQVCDPASVPSATYAAFTTTAANVVVNAAGDTGCGGWVCRDDTGNPQSTLLVNDFLEGGINLNDAGFTGCFATFLPHTRSSPSFDSVLEDFAGPFAFSNCKKPVVATTLAGGGHSGSALTVSAGDAVTDTATLSNTAGTPAGTVSYRVFTDNSCTVASTSPSVSQTVTLSGGVVPSTSPVTFSTPGTYYWQATYSGDPAAGGRNLPAISPCTAEVLTVLGAHIAIAKSADASPVTDGSQIGFTVTATNTGAGSAAGTTVSDPLPPAPGVSWVLDAANSDAGCSIGGSAPNQVLSCSFATLAPGASRHVHITSATTAATGTTTLINVASVTTTNDGSGQATATVSTLAAHIGVTKSADASPVSAGDPVGFRIVATNSGAGTAHGVTLTDVLPTTAGTSFAIDAQATNALNCSISPGTLHCGPQDLAPGASATVHLTSSTSAASCGTITNTASIASSNDGSGTSTATVEVLCPDVAVTKTAVSASINAGDPAAFSIVVANHGAGTAHGVTLTDVLPADLAWAIASQPAGSPCAISAGTLTCNLGDMAAGTTATISLTATTTAANCGTIANTATVSATDEPKAALADDSSTARLVVNCPSAPPSVVITKTADDNPESAGDEVGFVISVNTVGGSTASNVVMTDPLPAGTDIHWSIPVPVAGCSVSNGTLTCTRATLAAGAGFSVHVTSPTSYSTECDDLDNTASVTSSNAGSGTASASILIKCASIHITKTADDNPESVGDQIGFTVKVTNSGNDGALNPSMTDRLPSGKGVVWTIDTPVAGCAINNNVLTCNRSWLDPGESFTVHVTSPTTYSTECKTFDNTASVTSTNGGEDVASASIVMKCAIVDIVKSADAPTVQAGNRIGFTVKVTNEGTDGLLHSVMVDNLPGGDGIQWSLETPVPGCVLNANGTVLTCQRDWLDPGESFTVHLTSPTGMTGCTTLDNTAAVTSTNGGSDQSSASVVMAGCPALASASNTIPTASQGQNPVAPQGATEVLGAQFGRDAVPSSPALGAATDRTMLPVTGFDPRPLGLTALALLAAGGVLCEAARRRSGWRRHLQA